MFNWIRNLAGRRRQSPRGAATVRIVRAKFDSAQTTPDNRRHWVNADALSADAAASPAVRRTLRNRARYEVANNSYARGIVLTLANDVIGTGPRLQVLTDDPQTNRTIEREFSSWARAVGLADKLRTMRMAKAQDGEAFGLLFSNSKLASPVKLDVRLIEADQVTTPDLKAGQASAADGIVFDAFGNPRQYHVLKVHPGSGTAALGSEYLRISAESMIHWFRPDRPGQSRGLPDILPALPLFAQLRDYTLSVVMAARSAADMAVVMKTNVPPGGEAAEGPGDDGKWGGERMELEVDRNTAVFAPEGWEPTQIKAEQPATTYEMFKREIINEIARCLNLPYNIAACNSSGYNYASGRLDHQTYYKSIRVEQSHLESVVLDRILTAWLEEAVKVFGLGDLEDCPHQWFWNGHEHVDPLKEANAQASRLASNTTTLAIEYSRQGLDWEEQLRQRAKEVQLMNSLGLTQAQSQPAPAKDAPTNEGGDQTDGEEDDRAAV